MALANEHVALFLFCETHRNDCSKCATAAESAIINSSPVILGWACGDGQTQGEAEAEVLSRASS